MRLGARRSLDGVTRRAHEKVAMSQELENDDLEPTYDFLGAERGKYYQRYQQVRAKPTLLRALKDPETDTRLPPQDQASSL